MLTTHVRAATLSSSSVCRRARYSPRSRYTYFDTALSFMSTYKFQGNLLNLHSHKYSGLANSKVGLPALYMCAGPRFSFHICSPDAPRFRQQLYGHHRAPQEECKQAPGHAWVYYLYYPKPFGISSRYWCCGILREAGLPGRPSCGKCRCIFLIVDSSLPLFPTVLWILDTRYRRQLEPAGYTSGRPGVDMSARAIQLWAADQTAQSISPYAIGPARIALRDDRRCGDDMRYSFPPLDSCSFI